MRSQSFAFALLGILLFGAPQAHAQEAPASSYSSYSSYEAPDFLREPPTLPNAKDLETAKRVTLHDALQIAVEHNLNIVLRKDQFLAAKEAVPLGKSRFEPLIASAFQHTDSDSPPSTAQEGRAGDVLKLKNDSWSIGAAQRLPTGTLFNLDWVNSHATSSLGNAVTPTLYRSGLAMKLTQPILRGFAFNLEVPYVDVLRAEFTSEKARQDVLGQLITTVRDTELAYWDVVLTLKSYQVQRASFNLATEQLGLTRKQIDAGILPPSDMINAEGTVAQRELGLVQVENDIQQAADQLRRVLNLPRDGWSQPLLPVDAPKFDDRPNAVPTFYVAMAKALEHRPEWKQRKVDVDRAALDTRVASTERLPQLDASFSYGFLGQQTTYGGSLNQLTSGNAPVWTAGVTLSWTPLNIGANAQLRARQATEAAARTSMDQQLLDLHTELRQALRSVDTAARQVKAAGNFRVLAERSLDAEQRKFLNGTSNNFFIAQRQNDVLQAQLSEVAALIRHAKAVATLDASMGILLEGRRVRLDVGPAKTAIHRPQ